MDLNDQIDTIDAKDRRIAELEERVSQLEPLAALVPVLLQRIEILLERIRELEARVGQNSSNSSRPPSSDFPGAPPATTNKPTGRGRGGQPGHKKHERTLLPPERVNETTECKPKA